MVSEAGRLAALQRIARIKAERELQHFAAFSRHMSDLESRAEAMRMALQQSYASAAPLTLSEARVANAQAGQNAKELRRAEQQTEKLRPRFEAARVRAAREFGRAEVLSSVIDKSRREQRRD